MNILETIVQSTKARIESKKREVSLERVRALAESRAKDSSGAGGLNGANVSNSAGSLGGGFNNAGVAKKSFESALRKRREMDAKNAESKKADSTILDSSSATNAESKSLDSSADFKRLAFICEVKKASPSKGVINHDFPYLQIAKNYEANGADAISCLTEPQYFLGSDAYFKDIRAQVALPMIRKDFTIDEYMIYEARAMGADAVLLIASVLDSAKMRDFDALSTELGMSALIETHDAKEVESALAINPRIIGVNNRDLKTFEVNLQTSINLRAIVPDDILFVSESGIGSADDLKLLYRHNVDAVLIGEWFMRQGALDLDRRL
ncbi:hypothetical protein BKN38_05510 [Helicobacter sp. CLO-3]|uniref:indole-3-glycerol phosphate synthase TrpC n=1 Tax=unclassified Helicobacter TaxID=2593540 RepID=UPI0008056DF1|nr:MULTISPECIES: indole-3-glycerol phosphate synthase TrpC [unclassified Helicobacter]OBV29315.1 hypothetical protein BA723_06020 [Helicobacter sp. CLO-3]OHU83345.1 hypothetical protein BKN38_05510 [Helicobacter sp. CLO-3]